jgi:hypothetical protein
MKRLFFENKYLEEVIVPTRTGTIKIFQHEVVEGDKYLSNVDSGFLVPLTEEEAKEKTIRYVYYTQPYLLRPNR